MLKTSMTAGLLAIAMAAPAFAQTAPATAPTANSAAAGGASVQFMERMEATQFRGSDLMGRTVYNEQNENIGNIGDVVASREGQIQAVIIDVGGFLGIGASEVAVPFASLRFESAPSNVAGAPGTSATGRSAAEIATRNPSDVGGTGTAPTAPTDNMAGTNPASSTNAAANTDATTGTVSPEVNAASDASASSTLPERIILASTRQELESAPKFNDAAARPDGQSAN